MIDNNALDPITGFNIGQDFAFYRMSQPDTLSSDVLNGYQAKKSQGGTTDASTKFVRKWLNLRLHAFERGIHFSERISPDFLEYLCGHEGEYCQVTGEKITFATGELTDWSIDRIINQMSYTPDNIMIISTLANKAKNDLSTEEVLALSKQDEDTKGLTPSQWRKLYVIMKHTRDIKLRRLQVMCTMLKEQREFFQYELNLITLQSLKGDRQFGTNTWLLAIYDDNKRVMKLLHKFLNKVTLKASLTQKNLNQQLRSSKTLAREFEALLKRLPDLSTIRKAHHCQQMAMDRTAELALTTERHPNRDLSCLPTQMIEPKEEEMAPPMHKAPNKHRKSLFSTLPLRHFLSTPALSLAC